MEAEKLAIESVTGANKTLRHTRPGTFAMKIHLSRSMQTCPENTG